MSGNDDTRIVNMRINNKDFLKGTSESLRALDTLNKGVNNASKGQAFQDLGKNVETVKAKFGAMQIAGVTALATITNKAVNAGLNLVKSLTIAPIMDGFREYEKVLTSTQTIMANTGVSAGVAGRALDALNHYSDQTVYNFGQMADNIGKFTAAGVKIDDAVSSIKGLANSAALAGSSNEQLGTAMYQMSQALAQGTIKLMDWNSLSNAGMGGKNMRDSLMATARTIGNQGVAMDSAIKKYGNFRESLRSNWLTSKVFNKTMKVMAGQTLDTSTSLRVLEKLGLGKVTAAAIKAGATVKFTTKELQNLTKRGFDKTQISALAAGKTIAYTAKQLQKMGYSKKAAQQLAGLSQRAIESATKIKTFSQLIDVVKESIGSGWSGIFKQLFGNLTEAATMWTKVGDAVTGAVGNVFKGVIAMLKAWHDMKDASTGMNGFQLFWASIGNIFKSIGNLLHPFIMLIQDLLPATNDAGSGLFGLTQIFYKFSVWLEKITSGTSNLGPVISFIGTTFTIVGSVVAGVIKYFATLLTLVSPLSNGLLAMVGGVFKLVDGLLQMVDISGKIESLFDTIIAGRKAAFEPLIKVLNDVMVALGTLFSGDYSGFKLQLQDALGGLAPIGQAIANAAAKVQIFFSALGNSGNNVLDSIVKKLSSLAGAVSAFALSLSGAFATVSDSTAPLERLSKAGDDASNTGENMARTWSNVTSVMSKTSSVIGDAIGHIFDSLRNLDRFDLLNIFSVIFAGSILLTVRSFIKSLTGTLNGFKDIGGTFGQLTKNLKTMQTGVRSKIILNIAIAVAALTASLFILSKIPHKEMGVALGAIATMMSLLVGSMVALSKVQGKISLPLIAASLIAMAGALVILSAAVLAFGMMDFNVMKKGFAGIAVSLTLLVAAMVGLSYAGPGVIFGAAALVIAATALTMLAGVILLFSTFNPDTLSDGLKKIGLVMGVMAVSMIALSLAGPGVIIASAALLVLSVALTSMLGVISLFAGVSWETIISGVTKIAAAIVIIGLAGSIAAPGLLALGAAVGLIGLGVLALGAGLALIGVGLSAIAIAGVGAGVALGVAFEAFLTMLPLIATQLVAALVALVAAIAAASPRIVDALVKIGTELLRGLTELGPRVADAAMSLLEDFVTAFVDGRLIIFNAGIALILGFIDALATSLPIIIEQGRDLIIGFITGIGSAASDIAVAAAQAILDFLTAINNAVISYEPQIIATGISIARNLVLGLVQGLIPQPILDAFTGFVDTIVNFFTGLLGINSPSTVFAGFGRNIVQGLIGGISSLIGNIISTMGNLVGNVVGVVKSLPGRVRSALSSLGSILKSVLSSAWSIATNAVSNGVKNVGSAISRLPGLIRNALGAVGNAAKSVGSAIIRGIKNGLSGAVSAVGDLGGSLLRALKSVINSALSLPFNIPKLTIKLGPKTFSVGGQRLIPRFAGGTDSAPGGTALVGEVGPELVTMGRGASVITNKNLVAFMKSVAALTKAMSRGATPQANAQGRISYSVDAKFQGDPKASGIAFAANIAAGLINGLRANQATVGSTMAGVGSEMAKSFADILGIRSPSTVFYTYARYVGKGFINGLLASVSGVQKAASIMAKSATDVVSVTITNAQLKLEALRAKADAYLAASKNSNLSKNVRARLAAEAKSYTKAADAQQALVDKQNTAAERAKQYAQSDTAGKASMKNEDALAAARRASAQRQRAIMLSKEADLIRKSDKKRADRLAKEAKAALARAKTAAARAALYAKQASDLAARAKVEEASSGDGTGMTVSSVSAMDVLKAQAMFDRYTKLMADTQQAASQDVSPSVTFEQNNYSPEALSPAEAYRNGKNLVSIMEKKLVGAP